MLIISKRLQLPALSGRDSRWRPSRFESIIYASDFANNLTADCLLYANKC